MKARAAWQQSAAVGGVQPAGESAQTRREVDATGGEVGGGKGDANSSSSSSSASAKPASAAKKGNFLFRRKGHHKRMLAKEALVEIATTAGVSVPSADTGVLGYQRDHPQTHGSGQGNAPQHHGGAAAADGSSGSNGGGAAAAAAVGGGDGDGGGLMSVSDVLAELLLEIGDEEHNHHPHPHSHHHHHHHHHRPSRRRRRRR